MAPEISGTEQGVLSFIGKFLKSFFLLQYGGSLMNPAAATWIAAMFIISVAMGIVEAITWFEILQLFLQNQWPIYVIGLFAFGIGFIIWLMDAMFITIDISELKRQSPDKKNTNQVGVFKLLANIFSNKIFVTAGLRLIYVVVSLAFTAPFLSELLQKDELRSKIESHNQDQVAKLRQQLETDISKRSGAAIDTIENLISRDSELLRKELAGVGESKRFGEGPTTTQLKQSISRNEARLAELKSGFDRELNEVRTLLQTVPKSKEQIAAVNTRYKIDLLSDSPSDLQKVEAEGSGYKIWSIPAEKLVASALILLLFIAMVLLKIIEPKGATIYYDARLQHAYSDYQVGFFDLQPCLPEGRMSTGNAPLTVFSFDEWFYGTYEKSKLSDEDIKERQRRKTEFDRKLEGLHNTIKALTSRLQLKSAEHSALILESTTIDEKVARDQTALRHLSQRKSTLDGKITTGKATARNSLLDLSESNIVDLSKQLEECRVQAADLGSRKVALSFSIADATRNLGTYLASLGRTIETNPYSPGEDAKMDHFYGERSKLLAEQASNDTSIRRVSEQITTLGLMREKLVLGVAELRRSDINNLFSSEFARGPAAAEHAARVDELQVQVQQTETDESAIQERMRISKQSRAELGQKISKLEPTIDQLKTEIDDVNSQVVDMERTRHLI